MASIGKKILSAFVEVTGETIPVAKPGETKNFSTGKSGSSETVSTDNGKFRQYFRQLFEDANLPGPDYYEFSKMTAAMGMMADERSRYCAAFAGLQAQGLHRQQLLSSASTYIDLLEKDAVNFLATVEAAVKEKLEAGKREMEEKTARIQQLTQEISDLQQRVTALSGGLKENEQKIAQSRDGYKTAMEAAKNAILQDVEKIKLFIQ